MLWRWNGTLVVLLPWIIDSTRETGEKEKKNKKNQNLVPLKNDLDLDSDVVTTAAGILCKMHAGGDMNQLPSKVIYRIQVSQRSPFSMWSGIIIVCSRDVGRTSRGVYYDK